jgi:methylase of polypeptide subunit release factors
VVVRISKVEIRSVSALRKINFAAIPESEYWARGGEVEQRIHKIHSYPAKFPAFITTKALEVAKRHRIEVKRLGDLFCGCGTVAFEARRHGIDFWGCDINPVATLIARVKSSTYSSTILKKHLAVILAQYPKATGSIQISKTARRRLLYWHTRRHYDSLARLKSSIDSSIPRRNKYREFFYCAFSNTLKSASRWLTKSIKPQVDPNKTPAPPRKAFEAQCLLMIRAFEDSEALGNSKSTILRANVLDKLGATPKLDMIITSPPYVTSYEYADLHQLSSLWLGYAADYRELRAGSIGSLQSTSNFAQQLKGLNSTGTAITFSLYNKDRHACTAIAKYFLDMQLVARRAHKLLRRKGLALFVIGNTEYQSVTIDNAKHLGESLLDAGFSALKVQKRRVTQKNLTPYRDNRGQFTRINSGRRVYGQEFVIVARK